MAALHELELRYPREAIARPLLWELCQRHPVVFSLRRAAVSQDGATVHLELAGDEAELVEAEGWLRDHGLEVRRLSESLQSDALPEVGPVDLPPPDDTQAARKLWLTFGADAVGRPILWELGRRFGVTFDLRQANVGRDLGIVGLLLSGPSNRVSAACEFLEGAGVVVEPIEKSVVEG